MNVKKRYKFLPPDSACRGSVLFLALWALFFLALLSAAIAAGVRPALAAAFRLGNAAQARYLAESGVKKIMADVRARTQADALADFLSAGPDFRLREWPDGRLEYAFLDEERKININYASCQVLVNLFTARGLDPLLAVDLADAVLDWRGAQGCPRENNRAKVSCRGGPECFRKESAFEVPEEINFVKGMTPEIFDGIKDYITVYGSGALNINTADSPCLRAIGISEALSGEILRYRSGADALPATGDDKVFESTADIVSVLASFSGLPAEEIEQLQRMVSAGVFCVRSSFFSGDLRADFRGYELRADFVFVRGGALKFWREE
jgi:general secretion pathway protein K